MKAFSLLVLALQLAGVHAGHRHRKYRASRPSGKSAYPGNPTAPATPAVTGTPAPRGNGTTTGNSILIPLYSYPHNGAWDPLFKAADNHPNTTFIVIVNPDNGPTASPDAAFTEAVKKVQSYANIQAIGYIATGYGERSASAIVKDVETYSSWAEHSAGLDGIFFDETVSIYSSNAASTYETINQAVKGASGIQGQRTIVHNPGAVPAKDLENALTDITVIFESPYESYPNAAKQQQLESLSGERSGYSIMVYALSGSVDLSSYISTLAQTAKYLFVTDLTADFYAKFSPNWDEFVGAVSS